MDFEKEDEVNRSWVDGRTAPTKVLIIELAGRAQDDDLITIDDNTRAVMWCSARRLYAINKNIDTLSIGLVVTNAFWLAHWMGWI